MNLTLKKKDEISIMGQDKGRLTFNDCSLITHVCTVAQDCLDFVFVITPSTQKYQDLLPKRVQIIEEKIVLANQQSNFPLLGFYQGFNQLSSNWLLLLACDLPKLDSRVVREWLKVLDSVSSSTMAVLPRHVKGWEPLCGFYHRKCLPSLESYLESGGQSFQKWLRQVVVEELVVSDRSVLFNCNTWEEWQHFLSERKSDSQTSEY